MRTALAQFAQAHDPEVVALALADARAAIWLGARGAGFDITLPVFDVAVSDLATLLLAMDPVEIMYPDTGQHALLYRPKPPPEPEFV